MLEGSELRARRLFCFNRSWKADPVLDRLRGSFGRGMFATFDRSEGQRTQVSEGLTVLLQQSITQFWVQILSSLVEYYILREFPRRSSCGF